MSTLPKHLVRREKELMVKYIDAHKRGDHKTLEGVQKEMKRNVEQRRYAR